MRSYLSGQAPVYGAYQLSALTGRGPFAAASRANVATTTSMSKAKVSKKSMLKKSALL